MARQRFRLKELFQKEPQYYHATFDHITHKINAQKKKIPVVLLTDVYLVNDLDKKIRLVNSNDFKDKKGRHIVADHLWVKLTKPWFSLPTQLVPGDEIFFQASVEQYRIVRSDLLKKRDDIWQQAVKERDQVYKRWAKYTETHKRKNFQLSLDKMKAKQTAILKQAKQEQSQIELVDYSLNKLSKIKIAKLVNVPQDFERGNYNYNWYKRQGYKYSAWLAAHSMELLKK